MNTTLNDDDKLYRFISYKRLLDHLVNERFLFVKYTSFDDPWEGFFHKAYFKVNEHTTYGVLGENRPFIMCFTKRKVSEAMWRIYSKDTNGIQIVTSVGKLKKLVKNSYSEFDCHLQEVVYDDDIEKEDFFIRKFPTATREEKSIKCLFYKRKAFNHEEEVRLVLYSKTNRPDDDIYSVYADPNEIIEMIILDPRIDEKTENLQIRTLNKLGFQGNVVKSRLYYFKPIWYECSELDKKQYLR